MSYHCEEEDHVTMAVWQREAERAYLLAGEVDRLRAILADHCCDDEMCACQDPALNDGLDGAGTIEP